MSRSRRRRERQDGRGGFAIDGAVLVASLPRWMPLVIFAATVGILLYAYSRVVHVAWFDTFLDLHAVVTGGLIRMLGFDVETSGSILANDRVAFTIIFYSCQITIIKVMSFRNQFTVLYI